MFKFSLLLAALTTTPAPPPLKVIPVIVDSTVDDNTGRHIVTVHRDNKALTVLVTGCRKPISNSVYEIFVMPQVGVLMMDQQTAITFLSKKMSDAEMESMLNQVCILVASQESLSI